MKNYKKYIAEVLLIVFSVLFALFISKVSEDAKTEKTKANALAQIQSELSDNQRILGDWMKAHKSIVENLKVLIEQDKDSIARIVEQNGYVPMTIILDKQSLIEEPLSKSAWDSAQSIGILSEFDFETLQSISQCYELQDYIMKTSIDRIVEQYFEKSTNINATKNFLIGLKLRFENLQGQEFTLKRIYRETLKRLE